MLCPNDDDTAHVDNIWLGPRGWLLPWRARYSAYVIGFLLTITALWAEQKLGVHRGLWVLLWTMLAVIAATRAIGRLVSFEIPLRALAQMLRSEMNATRPDRPEQSMSIPARELRNSWTGKVRIR